MSVTTGLKWAPETAPEHPDQRDERSGGGGSVLQQLQADVVGGEAAGHDPRADDRHHEETCAQRLGEEPAGQVPPEVAGAGLWLVG